MTHSNKLGKAQPFLIFFFFLFISNALAFDNCNGQQPSDQIPCYILLQSAADCTTISVSFYNESTYLSSQVMSQYSPAICSANFTYNSTGTYNFNYSTGDVGAIVVTEGNQMIYLIYFLLALIALLTILGFVMQMQWIFLLDGLLMLVVSVWIFIHGISIYNNILSMVIASVIFAAGAYFTVMSGLSMIEED